MIGSGLPGSGRGSGLGMTHTFCLRRGLHWFLGVLSLAFGAVFNVFPIVGLFGPGFYNDVHAGDLWWMILGGVTGLFFEWMGIRQFRNGFQVSGQKLTIRNTLRTYTVDASDIRAITLQEKGGEGGTNWLARVELTAGKNIWIDNLDCGRAIDPPIPERAAVVDEIRALLGLGDADLAAETR